jgi:hypothetical protein
VATTPTVDAPSRRPGLAPSVAFANSARVWLVLVAFLGVVKVFITLVGAGLETDPRAQLFSWPVIGVIGLIGLLGMNRRAWPPAPGTETRYRFLILLVHGASGAAGLRARDRSAQNYQQVAQDPPEHAEAPAPHAPLASVGRQPSAAFGYVLVGVVVGIYIGMLDQPSTEHAEHAMHGSM